jgi:hypothetical protein
MKKWYESKTIWVNFIAILGIVLQKQFELDILNEEIQGPLLVLINVILRITTKSKIEWK